ncbi:MAG: HNH endonuclease [Nocardioides sp.]|nr:HNH endonuclease [Nocardioides sp.]
MGQGHFKRAVAAAYGHRCAVTASATFPSLEAAHIRPFAEGCEHAVANGLLLRTDVHRLYDRGYLSAGYVIPAPTDADLQPRRDALTWHYEKLFRAA